MYTSLVTIDACNTSLFYFVQILLNISLMIQILYYYSVQIVPLTKVCSHCLATGHINNMLYL